VGVIADIQTVEVGSRERRAVELLLDERPDVVLIAGDMFQGTAAQWERTRDDYQALLGRLASVPHGAFVVAGDVDRPFLMDEVLGSSGVQFLDSEVAEVRIGDRTIQILGMPLVPTDAADEALAAFIDAPRADAARLLLGHRPDWANRFGRGPAGVDLVVSGHTHGGQIQLPGIGPIMTMSEVPRPVAAGGLHDLGGQLVYVSTGVGMEQQGAPQIRLGARPSVALLTLR
jgi:predicted MPP superfamily phosphohydrolase